MTSRYSARRLCPPKPDIAVRLISRIFALLPVKSKISIRTMLLKKKLDSVTTCEAGRGVRFTVAGKKDLDAIIGHPEALSESVYRNRIRNDDLCVCVKQGDELVSYNWIRFTDCCAYCGRRTSFRFIPLRPNQAFTYDFYTYKKYRGKGLGGYLKSHLLCELQRRGIDEVLSAVEIGNHVSLKIHLRLGYELVTVIIGYGIFNWTKTFMGSEKHVLTVRHWLTDVYHS